MTVVSLALVGFFILGGQAQAATRYREFSVPTAGNFPQGITAGPDGNLWFTAEVANNIGRITTAGIVTGEFPIPTGGSAPFGITAGPDGNLWFTEYFGDRIGRITTAGVIRESPSKSRISPIGIPAGPDGNIWFTETRRSGHSEVQAPLIPNHPLW